MQVGVPGNSALHCAIQWGPSIVATVHDHHMPKAVSLPRPQKYNTNTLQSTSPGQTKLPGHKVPQVSVWSQSDSARWQRGLMPAGKRESSYIRHQGSCPLHVHVHLPTAGAKQIPTIKTKGVKFKLCKQE